MITVAGFTTAPNTSYDATDWQITGTVILTSGVKWKGGRFTGTGAAFSSLGNCIGCELDNVTLDPTINYMIEGNVKPFITYNGADATFLYKDLTINNPVLSGKTTLYNGTWEGPKTYHNVCFNMTVNGLVKTYDPLVSGNVLVFGNSIYKFRANDWKLIGDTMTGLVDNGVVQIQSGNGQLNNCYRRGKMDGYWMRCWGVNLGGYPDQDTKVINCVDAETVVYGTADFRIDAGLLQSGAAIMPLSGIDFYFINNTSANKEDIYNGYVSSSVILGQLKDDLGKVWTLHLKNNVAYGAHVSSMSGNSSLLKNNSSGVAVIDAANNIDIPPGQPIPAGIVDADYYGLTAVGAQPPVVVAPPPPPPPPVVPTIVSISVTYSDGTIKQIQ